MGKINVLSKEIAELIAAGEVIERPASIVKELLENSIDASATAVTVEIRNGGITYIRVTDNGAGMEAEDLAVAFLRHATSKIKNVTELDSIGTLGFRGEALASISAVSRMEISSKMKSMQFGCRIELEGGERLDFGETGCPNGTTVIVKDLFYNVPARLKFLKKNTSEGNSISGIMDKLALSHPEISLKLISDGKIKLNTTGSGDLLDAIHAVFGDELSSSLMSAFHETKGMKVSGYITPPQASRSNRGMQHFFVNGRYVRSKTCLVALEEGYKGTLMSGRYPACVLNIEMPLDTVDVNVHPAKIEVRFVNEREVFNIVYFAVKTALTQQNILRAPLSTPINIPVAAVNSFADANTDTKKEQVKLVELEAVDDGEAKNTRVSLSIDQEDAMKAIAISPDNRFSITATEPIITIPFIARTTRDSCNVASPQAEYVVRKPTEASCAAEKETSISANLSEEKAAKQSAESQKNLTISSPSDVTIQNSCRSPLKEPQEQEQERELLPNVKVIGELFSTFMLFEAEETFFLLDKHAAHERIIYEKLKKSVNKSAGQALLSPVIVALSAEEFEALLEKTEECQNLGFYYEEFGNHSVIVREIPMHLPPSDVTGAITDLAKRICEARTELLGERLEELLHSLACRAALKANDKTDISELIELLRLLYENDDLRHCPHGRPVVIAMTRKELEKKFGRT